VSVREKLVRRAQRAGVSLAPPVADGLAAYFELLQKWNRKVSLTALPVEDAGDEAIDRLLIEPALAAKSLPSPESSILDVGSGGGSPAIPLRLVAPGTSLRMVESKTRKAAFLREAARVLELERTEVDAVRFEELLARPELHETVDVVTLRAVKVEPKMLAALQSFLRPGGLLFLFGTSANPITDKATPQLTAINTQVLLKQWGSQLQILRKNSS
jgi:16S rRNA (guanine527-N7)-methyltransferase